jgi:Na+-transporting NADH:ubiquinone oxidoreductase subunit NqrD
MLGVFIAFAQKSMFYFITNFSKILNHIVCKEITNCLHLKRFLGTSLQKEKIVADLLGSGSKLNYACLILFHDFLEKYFLGPQVPISSENQKEISKIQHIAKNDLLTVLKETSTNKEINKMMQSTNPPT